MIWKPFNGINGIFSHVAFNAKRESTFLCNYCVCDCIDKTRNCFHHRNLQFIFTFSAWFWSDVRQRSGGIQRKKHSFLSLLTFLSLIHTWNMDDAQWSCKQKKLHPAAWKFNEIKSSSKRKGNVFNIYTQCAINQHESEKKNQFCTLIFILFIDTRRFFFRMGARYARDAWFTICTFHFTRN